MLSITVGTQKDCLEDRLPLALFVFEDSGLAGALPLPPAARKALLDRAKEEGFQGKSGETVTFKAALGGGERRVLLAGLGRRRQFDAETLRRAAGSLYRAARALADSVWVAPFESPAAAAEGMLLASHQHTRYRAPEKEARLREARFPAQRPQDRARLSALLERARAACEAVGWTRDLVNDGPSDKTPAALAEAAKGLAGSGVTVKVVDRKEAAKLGMGAFLGVARGSAVDPCLVHMAYKPARKARKRVALVGKGVTFDSGGLSLKPPQSMETMKCDMAGAAAVLGVFRALPKLKPAVEVHGIAPMTYNMPGPDAIKPGDVVRAMNGKTVEILNTDAEGRLILADALVYAARQKPDVILDLATLTGAQVIALGSAVTAAMTNHRPTLERLLAASRRAGEPVWELPLVRDYKDNIKSRIADLQNIGKVRGEAGAIIGGLFLQEFINGTPWIHFDIAGPAWSDSGHSYCQPGGTGAMVRTLLDYLGSL